MGDISSERSWQAGVADQADLRQEEERKRDENAGGGTSAEWQGLGFGRG